MAKDRINQFISDNTRDKKYKINSIIIFICHFLNLGISILIIPITMRYIGVVDYGVWITLVGIIEWFNFFDIGLGHGLKNRYAEAKAKRDTEAIKKYVSTAFFMLLFISICIFISFNIFARFVDWSLILNAPKIMSQDLKILAIIISGFFCIRFVVNMINILLTADQNPAIASLIGLIGSVLSLCVIYILTETTKPSILWIGISLPACQLFPILIAFIFFFLTKYRPIFPHFSRFSKSYIRLIFSLGIQFFFIQITAMFLFTTNNLIIAHTCGASGVTEFNVAYKYISIVYITFMTMLTPLWSACTDAYTRCDILWIEKVFRRMNRIWLLLIVLGLGLVILSPFSYNIWLKGEVQPDFLLLILLLVYMILWMRYTLYRTFMNATGKIRLQFYITSVESLLHIPLAIFMGSLFGLYGVVSVMIIWAAINSVWEPIQYRRILTNNALGVWNK